MPETTHIRPKFSRILWLLMKSWFIGLLVSAIIFSVTIAASAPIGDEPSKTLATAILDISAVFLLTMLAGAIFTIPLFIFAGVVATLLGGKIAQKPWVATVVTPIIGTVGFVTLMPLLRRPDTADIIDIVTTSLFNIEVLIILIPLTASAAYYSFKLRAFMRSEHDATT